jgi:ShK domain-like
MASNRLHVMQVLVVGFLAFRAIGVAGDDPNARDPSDTSCPNSDYANNNYNAYKSNVHRNGGDVGTERGASPSDDDQISSPCRDEHDDCPERSRRGLCDSDPSDMLVRCRKSCLICPQVGIEQDVGLSDGRVPMEVSIKMLRVVRETNQYHRTKVLNHPGGVAVRGDPPSRDRNALGRRSCHDRQKFCSLWRLQNRCADPQYGAYVTRECPLSCQVCDTDGHRARSVLRLLSEELPQVYYLRPTTGGTLDGHRQHAPPLDRDVVRDRFRTLSFFMSLLGMDPEPDVGQS